MPSLVLYNYSVNSIETAGTPFSELNLKLVDLLSMPQILSLEAFAIILKIGGSFLGEKVTFHLPEMSKYFS